MFTTTAQNTLEIIIDNSSLQEVVHAIALNYLKQEIPLEDVLKEKLLIVIGDKPITEVIEMLCDICADKAQHIEANSANEEWWEPVPLAQTWKSDRQKLSKVRQATTLVKLTLKN